MAPRTGWLFLDAEFDERLFEDRCPCTGYSIDALERLVDMPAFRKLAGQFVHQFRNHPIDKNVA